MRPVMVGAVTTVNDTELLDAPPAVTTIPPDVAPVGIVIMIEVALQELTVTAAPFKVTELLP